MEKSLSIWYLKQVQINELQRERFKMQEEAQIIYEAQMGQIEAVMKLWEQYRPLWKKWAKMITLEGWSIEDLEQQSYLILLDTLEKYQAVEGMPFGGYYKMRLVIWRNRQLRKKHTAISNSEQDERDMMNQPDGSPLVGEQIEQKLMAQAIFEAIETLGDEEQRILIGHFIQRKTLEQLGKELGLSLSGVKSKKRRSLMKLRKRFVA